MALSSRVSQPVDVSGLPCSTLDDDRRESFHDIMNKLGATRRHTSDVRSSFAILSSFDEGGVEDGRRAQLAHSTSVAAARSPQRSPFIGRIKQPLVPPAVDVHNQPCLRRSRQACGHRLPWNYDARQMATLELFRREPALQHRNLTPSEQERCLMPERSWSTSSNPCLLSPCNTCSISGRASASSSSRQRPFGSAGTHSPKPADSQQKCSPNSHSTYGRFQNVEDMENNSTERCALAVEDMHALCTRRQNLVDELCLMDQQIAEVRGEQPARKRMPMVAC